ncbi:MAG: cation:proton antiporter, partial [Alphaproteobacteria bacterium]|nr:cation:proton antiporter [Alphaproteobacteria bacterium]
MGVILLLFFIGMELSVQSFKSVWKVAVTATLAQIGASMLVVWGLTGLFDWPTEWAVLFGFCLALSSTAVAVKVLQGIGEATTRVGRLTVAVLIAQDLAVAPMLVIVGNLSGGALNWFVLVEVALSVGILVVIIVYLTRVRRVSLPFHKLLEGKDDLAPLASLAFCFLIAAIAGLVGLSPAFGAFLAGLIAGNSRQRELVHHNAGPIQAILLMTFFLSIGLLIDMGFIWDNLGLVLSLWLFVTVFKTMMNVGVLRLLGEQWQRAFMVSLVLGQLGEFAFVLGGAAQDSRLIEHDIYRLIVAVTVLSLISSPLYIDAARRLHDKAKDDAGFRATIRLIYMNEYNLLRHAIVNGIQFVRDYHEWYGKRSAKRFRDDKHEAKVKKKQRHTESD